MKRTGWWWQWGWWRWNYSNSANRSWIMGSHTSFCTFCTFYIFYFFCIFFAFFEFLYFSVLYSCILVVLYFCTFCIGQSIQISMQNLESVAPKMAELLLNYVIITKFSFYQWLNYFLKNQFSLLSVNSTRSKYGHFLDFPKFEKKIPIQWWRFNISSPDSEAPD